MPESITKTFSQNVDAWRKHVIALLTSPPALVLVPAFSLAAFWFGGEGALLIVAALLPASYLVLGGLAQGTALWQRNHGATDGLLPRKVMETRCKDIFKLAADNHLRSCIHIIEIDRFSEISERYGPSGVDCVIQRMGERLIGVIRHGDLISHLGDGRFAVCVSPVHDLSLELCIQMAGRLQTAAEEPTSLDGTIVYADVCIGFCQNSRAPNSDPRAWLDAALTALSHAKAQGSSCMRAYSEDMQQTRLANRDLRDEVIDALDSGAIAPWFQPQLCTDTGKITGFEALARWTHPVRGVLSPTEFLPVIEASQLLERLAEVMMYHSFRALKQWDVSGVDVPQVGVNFAGSELSNPRLLEKIKWDLDRFDLAPHRLAVEILETVVASAPDDMITRNINALGALGCRIDLDDFGTGNASIASIRRFAVGRIKIDRSFVIKADRDPEQQRMISAILTMAERLNVETLAEGIETVGEHVLLAQLGCHHVQGFGIARPMPFDQTLDWINAHNAKLQDVPDILQSRKN